MSYIIISPEVFITIKLTFANQLQKSSHKINKIDFQDNNLMD